MQGTFVENDFTGGSLHVCSMGRIVLQHASTYMGARTWRTRVSLTRGSIYQRQLLHFGSTMADRMRHVC
jgi:hypothetical protein